MNRPCECCGNEMRKGAPEDPLICVNCWPTWKFQRDMWWYGPRKKRFDAQDVDTERGGQSTPEYRGENDA